MELLEREIEKYGQVLPGNVLKVGSFLNQNINVSLNLKMGEEICNHYIDKGITKVLTVEASGLTIAFAAAQAIGCDMAFVKKSKTSNVSGETYSANCHSYTHNTDNLLTLPKEYLSKNDKVLIVDDFLANGNAFTALKSIVEQSGAKIVGFSAAIEKGFQGGGDALRREGYDVFSLAIIDSMENGKLVFRK